MLPLVRTFSVNVNALAEAEAAEAKNVLERMDQNRRDTLLQAQTEEVETLMFPHPSSGGQHNRQQHHHGDEHKHRGSGSFASRRRSRHSDSGATSLPSAEPSPLKQVCARVFTEGDAPRAFFFQHTT